MLLRKWLLGIGLLTTVAASVWEWPGDDVASTLSVRAPKPVSREIASVAGGSAGVSVESDQGVATSPRFLLAQSQLFAVASWRLPPPVPIKASQPPPLPALPFAYLGKLIGGSEPQYFLSLGSNTVLMRTGDVQEGYRLDSTTPSTLVFLHLASQQTQRLSIGYSN